MAQQPTGAKSTSSSGNTGGVQPPTSAAKPGVGGAVGANSGGRLFGRAWVSMTNYVKRKVRGIPYLVHRAQVERILGRELPPEVVIHHWDNDGENNTNSNLLVCPNESYHKIVHRRMNALEATGDANALKCTFCKQWDNPANIKVTKACSYHKSCLNLYAAERYKRQGAVNGTIKSIQTGQ